jgi:four helix bundle protein
MKAESEKTETLKYCFSKRSYVLFSSRIAPRMSRISDELRNRTKNYASAIVRLFVGLPKRAEAQIIGRQLLRSGTSVAANFREAARSRTTSEFVSKLEVGVQEADETELWLELLRDDCGIAEDKLNKLLLETNELISIFVTMVKRSKMTLKS